MDKTMDNSLDSGVTPIVSCNYFSGKERRLENVAVPSETVLPVFINGQETVTILCTPTKLTHLVLGFLYSEGIIDNMNEVDSLRICEDEPIADVRLSKTNYKEPPRRTLTSGCGSSISPRTPDQRVDSDLIITPEELFCLMRQLSQQQSLYRQCGGIHSSALCDQKRILAIAEDIGRHNTLDKIMGECLIRRMPTQDRILLTTGRISSEMLLKAAKMQSPIVVSRSSATERAISLSHDLGIAVIGYVRGNHLSVFSGLERLQWQSPAYL